MHSQSISSRRLDTCRVLQRSALQWLSNPQKKLNLAYKYYAIRTLVTCTCAVRQQKVSFFGVCA